MSMKSAKVPYTCFQRWPKAADILLVKQICSLIIMKFLIFQLDHLFVLPVMASILLRRLCF